MVVLSQSPCAERPRTGHRSEQGQALVEGAMTLLLLFVFLFAIFEAGRFLQVQQALTDAARDGARRSVAPLTQTSTLASDVKAVVKSYLRTASVYVQDTDITVDQAFPVTVEILPMTYTKVTVTYSYHIMTLSMFGAWNMTLTGQSLMRNETSQ